MRLYQRVMRAIVSTLDAHHGASAAGDSGSTRAESALAQLRLVGNTLHCASLFSLREQPHTFLANHPVFTGKERLLADEFELPDQYCYIEDPVSGVAFLDLKAAQKGLDVERMFISIDIADPRTIIDTTNFAESFAALMEQPEVFDGAISIHAGIITSMEPMLMDDAVNGGFNVKMLFRTLIRISQSGRVSVCEDPFSPQPDHHAITKCGITLAGAQELAGLIAGNVRCGMRELAYYQASKGQPDCRVFLDRPGQ